MRLYYRICELQNTLSYIERWKNKPKIEILKKAWITLNQSIKPEDSIILIEDQCSNELVAWFNDTCKTDDIEIYHIDAHKPLEYPHYDLLINKLDEYSKQEPEELHFICNDDYLYLPHCLTILKSIFSDGWTGFAVPYDYPDRYTLDQQYIPHTTKLTQLFVGSLSHWRSVPSCTGVTCAKGKLWQKYMTIVRQAATFHSDSYTWQAYAQDGCLCPIPGVATHLTPHHMTPLIDWDKVWDSTVIK